MFVVLITIYSAIFSLFSTNSQGTQLYDLYTQKCCDGTVNNLPEEANYFDYECCGTEAYKPEDDSSSDLTSLCCGDNLHSRVNRNAACCGTEVFEGKTHACHAWSNNGGRRGFRVLQLPDGTNAVCGPSEVEPEFYDQDEKICCSGFLFEKKYGMKCCGEEYINATVSKCCHEISKDEETNGWKVVTSVIHYGNVIPQNSACCDGTVIDAEKQRCCKGVAVDLPDADDKLRFQGRCCGTYLLTDWKTQLCVKDERIVRRENQNQLFCDGELHQISGNCTLSVYCIDDKVRKLRMDEGLCYVDGNYDIYDITKQVCGDNEIVEKMDSDFRKDYYACSKSSGKHSKNSINPQLIYRPPYNHGACVKE